MAEYIENIHQLMEECRSLSQAARRHKEGSPEWRAIERDRRRLQNNEETYRQEAKQAFVALNDWKYSERAFEPQVIGKHHDGRWGGRFEFYHKINDGMHGQFFDHQQYYRKDNRCFAIVTEPYLGDATEVTLDELRPRFHQHKLDLFTPPDPLASFWFPGATSFIVIAAQGNTIEWLPEQDGCLAHLWGLTSDEARAEMLNELKYGVEN